MFGVRCEASLEFLVLCESRVVLGERCEATVLLSVLLHSSVPAFLSPAFSPVPVGRAESLITSVSLRLEKQLQPPRDRSSRARPLIGRCDQVRPVIGGEESRELQSAPVRRERRHSFIAQYCQQQRKVSDTALDTTHCPVEREAQLSPDSSRE